jgi:hypothetical protein
MNIKKSIQVTLAASLLIMTSAVVAQALIPRTWVSSGGNDANACTRISPCGTFQGAHDKTSPGGQVNCVDAAEYGQVVINKSITINCDNTKASITATTSGISVAAGVSDIVTIRGIDIDGNGTGLQGINFSHGAALHVSKVHIRNFRSNNNFTAGILFQRNGNEYSELYVTDSDITDNGGSGPSSGGIVMFFQWRSGQQQRRGNSDGHLGHDGHDGHRA